MAATRKITLNQGLCICVFSLLFVRSYSADTPFDLACIEVKRVYTEKGWNENEVPIQAISGKI